MNLLSMSLTRDHDYHKFESQNYGTLWHFRLAMISLNFIMVAMVHWRSQRVTDRSRVDRTCLYRVELVFDQEMAVPKLCTISRANDFATALNYLHDCYCREISSTMSLKRSISFEAVVELRLTVWCWRVFWVLWKTGAPKRKNWKLKI